MALALRSRFGGHAGPATVLLDELEQHGEQVTLRPHDAGGRLDLEAILGEPAKDTLVYCCGPEGLLAGVEDACRAWPDGSLHIERFAAKEFDGDPDAEIEFEVECQRSGVTVTVPIGTTIFDAVEEAGVDVLGSCMEGICGTCECDIIDGIGDHRDSVLTDSDKEENQTIMICVSRSRSERLVLDL